MNTSSHGRIGLYLAALQLCFTLNWTVYVIFLPRLAAQVGVPASAVALVLMLDQLIFAIADWGMGVAADRVARELGRLGAIVATIAAASCLAFIALPWVAAGGDSRLFMLLVIVWAATSSALRAPPMALLGKYAAKPAIPWLASLSLLGLGIAGAAAPYLTAVLRDADPRLPFALASVAVLATTLGLGWAERTLKPTAAPQASAPPSVDSAPPRAALGPFLLAAALLGVGFQIHFSLNAAPTFLKFAAPPALEQLMPIFWIGFNLAILPIGALAQRHGGVATMALSAIVGALAAMATSHADGLTSLSCAQFIAGCAWAGMLLGAVAAALALGHGDRREGRAIGLTFSLFALATLTRIAIVWSQTDKTPLFTAAKPWLPVACWLFAGVVLFLGARRRRA